MIIGLTGKKRVGKDTFASVLVEEYGFTRVAFADALKEAALAADPFVEVWHMMPGCSEPQCCGDGYEFEEYERLSEIVDRFGWEEAKCHDDVRRLLQQYGSAIREIDPDFWIRAVVERIKAHGGDFVVTDVRYPNEADAIRNLNGSIFRITRPEVHDGDAHESETAMDAYAPVTFQLRNSGSVEALRENVRSIMSLYV